MMRPAATHANVGDVNGKVDGSLNTARSDVRNSTYSGASGISSITNDVADTDAEAVWTGNADADWMRCRALMRRLGRDGRKLEQWKRWLGGYYCEHSHLGHLLADGRVKKQWTEDEGPLPSQVALRGSTVSKAMTQASAPTLEYCANVLRIHARIFFPYLGITLMISNHYRATRFYTRSSTRTRAQNFLSCSVMLDCCPS